MTSTPELLDTDIIEMVGKIRKDPVLFVQKVIGAEPTVQQRFILETMAKPGAKGSFKSGHGTGKSAAQAWLILWFVSMYKDCRVPCTAPTAPQLFNVLWAEISKWHQRMHPWFKNQLEITSDRVFLKGSERTQFAVARTARKESPESLQGFHADELMFIIEEASGVPEQIFEVAAGALSTEGARVLMCGNPTQTSGYFYQSHHRMKHVWTTGTLSCIDSPRVSQEYIESMKTQYGEESDVYRVRVLGEFPATSISQLIGRELAENAAHKKVKIGESSHAPVVLGVDVAWEGDDRSCVCLRQGLRSEILGTWRNIDNMTLGAMVNQYWKDNDAAAVFIDVGWGTGVIDYLRQIGRSPIPVNFGSRATNSETYVNKRSEIWCEMKEWLESGGSIPNRDDLIEDLVSPNYHFSPNGKRGLEKKSDLKKRGLPSPDLGDALALTFSTHVGKQEPHNISRLNSYRGDMVMSDSEEYDPFN